MVDSQTPDTLVFLLFSLSEMACWGQTLLVLGPHSFFAPHRPSYHEPVPPAQSMCFMYNSFFSHDAYLCSHRTPPRRITLADSPPDDPEGSLALPNGLYNPTLLKDLAWLNYATSVPAGNGLTATSAVSNAADIASEAQTTNAGPSFCISDFLVPGLQTKVWEDWQSADDMNDFT